MTQLLVVEDQPLVANAMRRALRAAGYDLTCASSCSGAMHHAGYFPCAIMDIELGDGDGIELAEKLISLGRLGAVVFHSGCCDPLRESRARSIGELVMKSQGSVDRVIRVLGLVFPKG